MKLPKHDCSLELSHNEHKNYYETAQDWLDNNPGHYAWESEEDKQKAIGEDSIWTLQWYPQTPIGFYAIASSNLESLLKRALEIEAEDA